MGKYAYLKVLNEDLLFSFEALKPYFWQINQRLKTFPFAVLVCHS